MTTNSPNPVDGDVQALIERLNRIAARWHNVGCAHDIYKAVELLTTPPAQLFRPVDLSGCTLTANSRNQLCMPVAEVIEALRQQGYEVKS